MAYLANTLSLVFTRRTVSVIDKTGLSGEFDFHFEYSEIAPNHEQNPLAGPVGGGEPARRRANGCSK